MAYVTLLAKNPDAAQPDPVFALAGGPGQAADAHLAVSKSSLAEVHERHDLVFVDQRGTGASNGLVPNGRATLDRIVARLEQAPASVELADPHNGKTTTVQVTANMFASGLRLALYDASWAAPLPVTLAAADQLHRRARAAGIRTPRLKL